MKKLFIILFLPVQIVFAQTEISLEDCYSWARKNYPNLQQTEIWQEIATLKKENLKKNFLPQIMLNGQATYQSDVTKIDISLPNFYIPTVSKDQYKAYAEIKQAIWDGGTTQASIKLEDAILQSNLSELEVEVYRLNDQVAQFFFSALAMNKQNEVLAAQKRMLDEKLKAIDSGIKNGMLEKSSALVIQAEILNLEQNQLQVESVKKAAFKMLTILTGENIEENSKLHFSGSSIPGKALLTRPENQLFANQNFQLKTQMNLLEKSRNPTIFGFGQAGYGRPGLNMLNDEFESYYFLGIGFKWNVFDWKKTSRQKQAMQLQHQLINRQEETFIQNMNLLLAQQFEQIGKLEKLLLTDSKMVELRTEIAKISASKLENETITTSDYIQDMQAETISKLNLELHKIQLNEATEKYRILQGKTDNN